MKILLLLIITIFHTTIGFDSIIKIISASREFITQGVKYQSLQVSDTTRLLAQYDFIIIGGGTAGCIIANRLSELQHYSILLIEAGGDENYIVTIPALSPYLFLTNINWGHKAVRQNNACLAYRERRCGFPRGKGLGGSSLINGMFFTRGNKKDYDRWLEMGNIGWGYDDILPYFKKLESLQIKEYINKYRNTEGPVPVSYTPYSTSLGTSFINSVIDLGYKIIDSNAEFQTGIDKPQFSIKNGSRYSSNRAYLMPIKNRKNLHVVKNAYVTKIIIDPINKIARGVRFNKNGRRFEIYVKKEVILTAGSFGSAQILMLSGIGPKEHLNELKIPVIKDLKVGYNLQDHVSFSGLLFLVNQPITLNFRRLIDNLPSVLDEYFINNRGPLTSSLGSEAISFVNTKLNNDSTYPDIELVFGSSGITQDPLASSISGVREDFYNVAFKPVEKINTFSILPFLLRPQSFGRLTLKSRNPYELPDILANYYKEDIDIERMLQGIRIAIKIAESKEFQKFGTRLHNITIPGCNYKFNSDDFWRCSLRQLTLVSHHFCGTAKMGPQSDPNAVVDPQLRVYGIKGLRVIDASIFPFVPSAHTAVPVMMVAEKGADLIKSDWK